MKKKGNASGTIWRSLILIFALIITVSLGYRFLFGGQSVFTWHELKQEELRLSNELVQIDQALADVSREIRLLQTDDAYLEKMIRERLNYVKEGEILYIFDSKEESSPWAGQTAQ